MAWLKKKFQGAMEKWEKDDGKLKVQSAAEGDTYNKLDDTSLLGDSLTSQPGDFKTLLAKQQQQEEESESSDRKPEVSEASDSDRESIKRSDKSWDSDRAGVGSGANRVFGASCSGKSDSDRESGKKSSKSSPEAEKKSSEKKKKVKTHRRVSSASALSALGGFIKKGHKRERSDGHIVVEKLEKIDKPTKTEKQEKREKTPEKQDKTGKTDNADKPGGSDEHMLQAFDDSSVLLKERRKDTEKKERKEIEQMFRTESPTKLQAFADTNPFRASPVTIGDEREFTNMSFVIEGEERDESVDTVKRDEIRAKLHETLQQWQQRAASSEQMYDLASRMIEKRKADMLLAVTELTNDLKAQLHNRHLNEARDVKTVISKLLDMQDAAESDDCSIQLSDIPHKPPSEPYEMTYDKEADLKTSLIPIFGQIEIKPISQFFGMPRDLKSASSTQKKQYRKCVTDSSSLLQTIEYCGVFVTKTTKDVRECGITDLTMTNDNEIVVVDRHNKLVKVFDYKGTLLRFVGRHSLKQPSRATVLPWSNQILVSDNATQTANLYHSSGSILSDFATDLKFPIAHCIVGDNQVAVIDFEPKEVAVYTFDQCGGHSKTKTFPLLMECPAYIAATPEGNIAVSDWSVNKVKIFDRSGELIKQLSKVGSGPAEFKKPQGVSADCYGNLFVMEQTNHRIQVFDTRGEYVHKYDKTCHEFGVPMCMKTTNDGHFILCEYQGNVKLFKYMDIPNMGLFNYEAPPPRPTIPSPSNAIWPMNNATNDESESMF